MNQYEPYIYIIIYTFYPFAKGLRLTLELLNLPLHLLHRLLHCLNIQKETTLATPPFPPQNMLHTYAGANTQHGPRANTR